MDWSGCEQVRTTIAGHAFICESEVSADDLWNAYLAMPSSNHRTEDVAKLYPTVPLDIIRSVLTHAAERAGWDDETLVDWSGCQLVERVVDRCSGAPTIVGSRIFPDIIAEYHWSGSSLEEILEDYPSLSPVTVKGLIRHIKEQEASAA